MKFPFRLLLCLLAAFGAGCATQPPVAPAPTASTVRASAGLASVAALGAAPVTQQFLIPRRALAPKAPVGGASIASVRSVFVRFFKFKFVQDIVNSATAWLAEKIEKKRKNEGLKLLSAGFPEISGAGLAAKIGPGKGRALLLVHGIFSSAEASFGTLLGSKLEPHLRQVYGDRILAWDHFTVSKSTFENARDLLHTLPDGADVDIMCHSRGAVVTR